MIYSFLGFELDEERFELRRGDEPVRLEPRVLEVVLYLIRNRDRVVPKDELIEKVWGVKFVSESALHHAIQKARQAFGGPPDEVIKTVHGRGFRFVAFVQKKQRETSDVVAAPEEVVSPAPAEAPESPIAAPVEKSRRRPPRRLLAAAAVALLAVGLVLWSRSSGSHAPEGAGSPWYVPASAYTSRVFPVFANLKQLTSARLGSVKPAFSADGKVILFGSSEPDSPGILDLYVMPAGGGTIWKLTEKIAASGDIPVWSADGSQIFFSRWRTGEDGTRYPDLWSVGSFGGKPRLFLTEAHGAGFSPDGMRTAYTKYLPDKKALWLSPLSNLKEHREVAPLGFVPRFSPDGKWLAYTTSDPNGGEGKVFVLSVSSLGPPRELTHEPMQMYGLTWRADSRALIFAGRHLGPFHLWQVPIDGGGVVLLTGGVGDYSSPSCSPDGKTLIFAHGHMTSNLMLADGLTSQARALTGDESHRWPRLSATAQYVASVLQRPDFGENLYLTDIETGTKTRLTNHRARQPCWIDVTHVAYLVEAESSAGRDVRVVDIQTGEGRLLTRFPQGAEWLAVHPNGKILAVSVPVAGGRRAIALRDPARPGDQLLAEGWEFEHLRFSPDGGALSWSGPARSAGPETNGVFVLELPAGKPQRLFKDGYEPMWGADGKTLYFSRIGELSGLWMLERGSSVPRKVRDLRYVTFHDMVRDRLVFTQEGGPHQIFAVPFSS